MVGEQIAQFSFAHDESTTVPCYRRTSVSLGLVGEDLVYTDTVRDNGVPVVTKSLVDMMSTFGSHTESCEVENGQEA